MKQKDLTDRRLDIPQKPVVLHTGHGSWPLCPNCGRHLVQKYDKEHDGWVFDDKCVVCGQLIFDVQKESW